MRIERTLMVMAAAMAVLLALAIVSVRMQYDTARAVVAIARSTDDDAKEVRRDEELRRLRAENRALRKGDAAKE